MNPLSGILYGKYLGLGGFGRRLSAGLSNGAWLSGIWRNRCRPCEWRIYFIMGWLHRNSPSLFLAPLLYHPACHHSSALYKVSPCPVLIHHFSRGWFIHNAIFPLSFGLPTSRPTAECCGPCREVNLAQGAM